MPLPSLARMEMKLVISATQASPVATKLETAKLIHQQRRERRQQQSKKHSNGAQQAEHGLTNPAASASSGYILSPVFGSSSVSRSSGALITKLAGTLE